MNADTFAERRATACAGLADLEREQGAAWLDGKKFDPARIDAMQAEISAIEAAEVEQTRRDREAEYAAAVKDRQEARKEARTVQATQAAALVRIEESVKALVADISVAQRGTKTLATLFVRAGLRAPLTADTNGIFRPLSRLIASEISHLHGRCYFGDLSWPSVPPKADWAAFAAMIAAHLAPLTEGD
jgi:hypothetical protein